MSLSNKDFPLASGLLDYFPDALMAVANCSKVGNDQHNPGQPMHWAKDKSADHADALLRHLKDRGTLDTDGVRHSAKVAWRALANLQAEIEDSRRIKVPIKVEQKRVCGTCRYQQYPLNRYPCVGCFGKGELVNWVGR